MKQSISGMFMYQRLLEGVNKIAESTMSNEELVSIFEYDIFMSAEGLYSEGYLNQQQVYTINEIEKVIDNWEAVKAGINVLKKSL